jgi:hypothetical protein
LDDTIKSEIKEIDFQIQLQHDAGHNMIVYNLPANFMVNEADIRDAQIYVYSELISSYESRGFSVALTLGDEPKLVCKWINKMSIEDLDRRRKLIKDRTISSKK